jgi:hypothetical protein
MLSEVPHTKGRGNEIDAQTKASPIAAATALVNKNIDMTKLRIFLGALVNAYSRPVIDAKISDKAISTYLYESFSSISLLHCKRVYELTSRPESTHSRAKRVGSHSRLGKY